MGYDSHGPKLGVTVSTRTSLLTMVEEEGQSKYFVLHISCLSIQHPLSCQYRISLTIIILTSFYFFVSMVLFFHKYGFKESSLLTTHPIQEAAKCCGMHFM